MTTEVFRVTLDYVRGAGGIDATKLPLNGSQPMLADLPVGGHKVTGMADGTASTDGATVGQVTTAVSGKASSTHASTHITGGTDVIPGPNATHSGLVPLLPTDSAYYVFAISPDGSSANWYSLTADYLDPNGNTGVLQSTNGVNVVLGQVGNALISDLAWSKLTGTPTITATSPIRIDGGASANLSTNRTLSILSASGSNSGSMSSTHYTKLEAVPAPATILTGSLTSGKLPVATGATTLGDSLISANGVYDAMFAGAGHVGSPFVSDAGYRHIVLGTSYWDGSNWITPGVGTNAIELITTSTSGIGFYTANSVGPTGRSTSNSDLDTYLLRMLIGDAGISMRVPLTISDGSQGANKLWASDANGKGTWTSIGGDIAGPIGSVAVTKLNGASVPSSPASGHVGYIMYVPAAGAYGIAPLSALHIQRTDSTATQLDKQFINQTIPTHYTVQIGHSDVATTADPVEIDITRSSMTAVYGMYDWPYNGIIITKVSFWETIDGGIIGGVGQTALEMVAGAMLINGAFSDLGSTQFYKLPNTSTSSVIVSYPDNNTIRVTLYQHVGAYDGTVSARITLEVATSTSF